MQKIEKNTRKKIDIPKIPEFKKTEHTKELTPWVEKTFKKHPGSMDNFWLPTTENDAKKLMIYFIEKKFSQFGPYEDAIKDDDIFGFHTNLSPLLNNGLITPEQLISTIIKKGHQLEIPIQSIEGLIRQIIGWREFVKGIYDHYSEKMDQDNFWNHKRSLTKSWYEGTTGILPLDDSIKKAQNYGYTHHIERLMVLSNMMLLCEVEPKQVHRWFMEMYVDSADWVMAANVYGMGQMSEGGIFSTKPYICGSNYIIKMSHYKKDDWCETMDGLYWRFVDKHQTFFKKNPRMSMMANMLKKIDPDRKKRIFKKAEGFIKEHTD